MGMYDTIYCAKKLPLNDELKNLPINWKKIEFQTKCLDNSLSTYHITSKNSLIEIVEEYEYTYYTEEEKKAQDFKPWNVIKDAKLIKQTRKKLDFHGKITFYGVVYSTDSEEFWVDFDAYFIYGKLDKIELAKFEKFESNKLNLEKFFEERKVKESRLAFTLKKRLGYFYLFRCLNKLFYKMSRFFSKLQNLTIKFGN